MQIDVFVCDCYLVLFQSKAAYFEIGKTYSNTIQEEYLVCALICSISCLHMSILAVFDS